MKDWAMIVALVFVGVSEWVLVFQLRRLGRQFSEMRSDLRGMAVGGILLSIWREYRSNKKTTERG